MPTPAEKRYDIESVAENDFIAPTDGHQHGRWGYTFDDRPAHADTVAEVAGGTAHADDAPSEPAAKRVRGNHAALSSKGDS